jgi:hypothetical protein
MAKFTGSFLNHENGLSEVIGFVLIIGLLVVVFSVYLAYGIPAQGRENEILHMNVVKDQFIEFKIGLDSLLTNAKVGTTLSNSFTLGTTGGYTQGMMSIIPIMSPVSAGGTIAINRRTTVPETLNITSRSLILNETERSSVDLPAYINFTPSHVFVNIFGIQSSDLARDNIFGVNVSSTGWIAIVNLTPQVTFYQWYAKVTPPGGSGSTVCTGGTPDLNQNGTAINVLTSTSPSYSCLVPINAYNYTGTDLSVKIIKNNVTTMENYPVHKKVAPGVTYSVDLMDDAYGLNPLIKPADPDKPPASINLVKDKPLNLISATGNITYHFSEMDPYTTTPIPLGSIEYRAQNNYWISQNYYYQIGGVFLSQSDGNNTYKLPPEISFFCNQSEPAKKIVTVNINALTITDPYGGSVVGGNSPVQIKTTLNSISPLPYVEGTANTKWIRIGINTTDDQARLMWMNYFNYTAMVAGIPKSYYTVDKSGNESYIDIQGYDPYSVDFDVNVAASKVTYASTVYGVGGIVR